jgi:hypothetical protein
MVSSPAIALCCIKSNPFVMLVDDCATGFAGTWACMSEQPTVADAADHDPSERPEANKQHSRATTPDHAKDDAPAARDD